MAWPPPQAAEEQYEEQHEGQEQEEEQEEEGDSAAYHHIAELQAHGIAANDTTKLAEAGYCTVESIAHATIRKLQDVKVGLTGGFAGAGGGAVMSALRPARPPAACRLPPAACRSLLAACRHDPPTARRPSPRIHHHAPRASPRARPRSCGPSRRG